MSGIVIPLPGLAVHIWSEPHGGFGVKTMRGRIDPDFPPCDHQAFDDHGIALDHALAIQERTGLPVITHVEGFL